MSLKAENPAKINLKNIGAFLQGYTRKFSEAFGLLPLYKREQVVWRSKSAQVCTDNGRCIFCSCVTPAKYYADGACEDPDRRCYPEMMSEQEWEVYKRDNNIIIKID